MIVRSTGFLVDLATEPGRDLGCRSSVDITFPFPEHPGTKSPALFFSATPLPSSSTGSRSPKIVLNSL